MKLIFTVLFFIMAKLLLAYNTEISEVDNSEMITKFQVNMEVNQMKTLDNKIYLNLHDTLNNKNYIVVADTNFNIIKEQAYDDEQIWLSDDMLSVAGANVINAKNFVYDYSIYDINTQDVLFSGETNDSLVNYIGNDYELKSMTFELDKLQYIKDLDTLIADSYLDLYGNSGNYIIRLYNNFDFLRNKRTFINSYTYYYYLYIWDNQLNRYRTTEYSRYSSKLLFDSGQELHIHESFPVNQKFNYIQPSNDEKYFAGVYFVNREIGNLGGYEELYLYKMEDFGLYDKIELKENYRNCFFSEDNNFLFLLYEDAVEIYDMKIKSVTKTININDSLYPTKFSSIVSFQGSTFSFDTTNLYKLNLIPDVYDFKARFTADKQKVLLNEEINFSDLSAGEDYELEWDFGEGTTSNESNPLHSYDKIGAYDVSLTITSKNTQDVILLEDYVQVFDDNMFFIEKSTDEGFVPFESTFKCYSYEDYINYEWIVNDKVYNDINGPTVKFENFGYYDINVVAYDYFGSDTLIDKKAINAKLPYIGFEDYEEYFPEYDKEIKSINAIKSKQGGYLLQIKNSDTMDSTEIVRLNKNFDIIWKKEYTNNFKSANLVEQQSNGNYIVVSDSSNKYNNYEIDILDDFGYVQNQIDFNEGTIIHETSFNIQDVLIDKNRTLLLYVGYKIIDNKKHEILQISELKNNELVTLKEINRPFPDNDNRYLLEKDNEFYYITNKVLKDNTTKETINSIISVYDYSFQEIVIDTLPEIDFTKVEISSGLFLGIAKYNNYDEITKNFESEFRKFRPTARIDDFVKIDNYLFMPHYNNEVIAGLSIYNLNLDYFYDNIFFLSRFAELYDIKYEEGNLIFFGKIQSSNGEQLYILKAALDNFISDTTVENHVQKIDFLYPNPAEDYIEITINKPSEGFEIEIYDVLGEKVISQSIHPMTRSHRMNIAHLPIGVYFVRIGERFEKFIKK